MNLLCIAMILFTLPSPPTLLPSPSLVPIAKALSTTASTASFDKNPQSKERGITLDLGGDGLLLSQGLLEGCHASCWTWEGWAST